MEFVYGRMVVILSKEQAIEMSLKHPNSRVEIFSKNFSYYKNGILH